MTAQIADTLVLHGREYSIVAIEEEWPFSPRAHGFEPVPLHTACWRGFYCRYEVIADELLLDTLTIGLGDASPPRWRAIEPRRGGDDPVWEYAKAGLPIACTGGMIAAAGFLPAYYVHLGFQAPYAYETVLELRFAGGRLLDAADRSPAMAGVRAALDSRSRDEIAGLVDAAFSGCYPDGWF